MRPLARFRPLIALLVLVLAVAACDSGNDKKDDENTNPLSDGTLTATVGGSSFTATLVVADLQDGVLAIAGNLGTTGSVSQKQITIGVNNASKRSYTLGTDEDAVVIYSDATNVSAVKTYVATSGTLTITDLGASSAKGTFSFTGMDPSSMTTISVTNGQFDVDW